jgi:hypothetical protein|tara:strand:- start:4248 stop:4427 length:180 start_codon:yes stop_codon:yes gene_type:complete
MSNIDKQFEEIDDLIIVVCDAIDGKSDLLGLESVNAWCNNLQRARKKVISCSEFYKSLS